MLNDFRFRELKLADCEEVSKIRLETNESGFLPALGETFYTLLMKATCKSKYGFGIVCVDNNNRIKGFVCATTHLLKYQIEIIFSHLIPLIFLTFKRIIRRPELVAGLTGYLLYPNKIPCKNIKAEWLTMVVKKSYRNMGIGKEITISLIEEYGRKGIKQFKSTVPQNNRISRALHEKSGFRFKNTFILNGESINMYLYDSSYKNKND